MDTLDNCPRNDHSGTEYVCGSVGLGERVVCVCVYEREIERERAVQERAMQKERERETKLCASSRNCR